MFHAFKSACQNDQGIQYPSSSSLSPPYLFGVCYLSTSSLYHILCYSCCCHFHFYPLNKVLKTFIFFFFLKGLKPLFFPHTFYIWIFVVFYACAQAILRAFSALSSTVVIFKVYLVHSFLIIYFGVTLDIHFSIFIFVIITMSPVSFRFSKYVFGYLLNTSSHFIPHFIRTDPHFLKYFSLEVLFFLSNLLQFNLKQDYPEFSKSNKPRKPIKKDKR